MPNKILSASMQFFSSECYWFSLIGKLYAVFIAYKIIAKVWHWSKLYLFSPSLGLAKDVTSFGKWAVVTGATDGIGKSYAEQLAKKGMNIVLISRSIDKLNSVAKEISGKYNSIETMCIAADFSQDVSVYDKIKKKLKDIDIGVLVNNVGMAYEHPMYLDECPDVDLSKVVTVNCFSIVFMTKLVLPKMCEKKKGLIINLASVSAHIPCPFLSVYAATKAFVYCLSENLHLEYGPKGITIQCVSPGYVATKMSKIKKESFMAPGPDSFVSSALATVGLRRHVFGCFAHDLMKTGLDLIGGCLSSRIITNQLKAVREKNLKKVEKTK